MAYFKLDKPATQPEADLSELIKRHVLSLKSAVISKSRSDRDIHMMEDTFSFLKSKNITIDKEVIVLVNNAIIDVIGLPSVKT